MKLGTCRYQAQQYVFILQGDQVLIPALVPQYDQAIWRDMLTLIDNPPDLTATVAAASDAMRVPLADIELLAPIPRPPVRAIASKAPRRA